MGLCPQEACVDELHFVEAFHLLHAKREQLLGLQVSADPGFGRLAWWAKGRSTGVCQQRGRLTNAVAAGSAYAASHAH